MGASSKFCSSCVSKEQFLCSSFLGLVGLGGLLLSSVLSTPWVTCPSSLCCSLCLGVAVVGRLNACCWVPVLAVVFPLCLVCFEGPATDSCDVLTVLFSFVVGLCWWGCPLLPPVHSLDLDPNPVLGVLALCSFVVVLSQAVLF